MIKTDIALEKSACCRGNVDHSRYVNCISLGWFCGVASSMNRYGLRNHSGPFDWYFSGLESVLKLMETDFYDFMAKENLFVDENDSTVFHDKKYGFACRHDIQNDFATEYEGIYQKYMRRAEQFMRDVRQPALFIRAVRSENEILYIEENREYIYEIIKRSNTGNEIIFLTLNTMKKLPDYFLQFRLGMEGYIGKTFEMRTMFDTSEEFSEYCKKNILSSEQIDRNKRFDREHFGIDEKVLMLMDRADLFDMVSELKKFYSNMKRGLYLFGAGIYGELVSLHLVKKGITVKGIIDNDQEKQGSLCNGIPVISLLQIEYGHQNIFVTVRDKRTEEIEKQLLEQCPDSTILTLRNIVEHWEREKNIIL